MLNRTGFSKATKKMEKMTRIKCQAAYMAKVEKTLLSSSTVIDDLQSQVESMFGASFEKGSRKKAIQRLRYMGASTNHHFASWRAGILLGAAVPALIDGLVKSSQADVQARIPYYATSEHGISRPVEGVDHLSDCACCLPTLGLQFFRSTEPWHYLCCWLLASAST